MKKTSNVQAFCCYCCCLKQTCLLNKWENDDSDFLQGLYSVYKS